MQMTNHVDNIWPGLCFHDVAKVSRCPPQISQNGILLIVQIIPSAKTKRAFLKGRSSFDSGSTRVLVRFVGFLAALVEFLQEMDPLL